MDVHSNNPPVPFARVFCWAIVVSLVGLLPVLLASKTSLRDPLLKPAPQVELDKLLSADPKLAIPEVQRAIEERDSLSLRVAWLQAGCADVRNSALGYFLRFETEHPSTFIGAVQTIARERDERVSEIHKVESSVGRHRP